METLLINSIINTPALTLIIVTLGVWAIKRFINILMLELKDLKKSVNDLSLNVTGNYVRKDTYHARQDKQEVINNKFRDDIKNIEIDLGIVKEDIKQIKGKI